MTSLGLLIDFRHIGLFYLPFTLFFLVYQAVVDRRRLWSAAFLKWGAAGRGGGPGRRAAVRGAVPIDALGGKLGQLKEGGLEASSADLLSFVLPPMTHPLLGQIPILKQWMQSVWTRKPVHRDGPVLRRYGDRPGLHRVVAATPRRLAVGLVVAPERSWPWGPG